MGSDFSSNITELLCIQVHGVLFASILMSLHGD